MTDEELIARLRSCTSDEAMWSREAADRIEALVKEKERLGREVNRARYGQPDFAWSIHKQAMSELRARADRLEAAAGKIAAWTIEGKDVDDPEIRRKYPLVTQAILDLRAALKGDAK